MWERIVCSVRCVSSRLDTALAVWEDRVPNVAQEKTNVLWDSVMLVNLNGFSDAPSVPVRFFHYEGSMLPFNYMVCIS